MVTTIHSCSAVKSEELMVGKYSETVGTCSELEGTCFRIGKNEIPVGKRSGIGIIVEYCGIPS
jgi:hypothetical protein